MIVAGDEEIVVGLGGGVCIVPVAWVDEIRVDIDVAVAPVEGAVGVDGSLGLSTFDITEEDGHLGGDVDAPDAQGVDESNLVSVGCDIVADDAVYDERIAFSE